MKWKRMQDPEVANECPHSPDIIQRSLSESKFSFLY